MDCIKLEFKDKYFEDEYRDDFLVTNERKKIWAVQLDLLSELLRVCKKNDIKVFAYAGTLLGAVRHHGFIPWDDDIDVCLERKEYEKLLKVASEFETPYFFQTAKSDKEFFIGYARLRNSLTTGFVKTEKSLNYNGGIYIDIFVLDGFNDNMDILSRQLEARRRILQRINLFHWDKSNGIKKIIKRFCKSIISCWISYEDCLDKYDKCISRYNDRSEKLSLMTHKYELLIKYWCFKHDMEETIEVPFENLMIPIPKAYDSILKNIYGNYMEFPPLEDRGKWHDGIIQFNPDIPYKEFIEFYDKEAKQ